ncbi:hypothetical protein [Roseibium salinum]|uniref:Uncharacterized protein n=1 Tax=Roseibium salinum TaxID=1604349 RepID=A0ABT3R784_9HYPH|nr:hypothetical protein [Roseibium sp. DSM 29163]MCX2724960.1 hypothetical protein [Roseibium sp. DSM 29163]
MQVVSATVLIDTLILVFAGMTVWAVGGYLKLALVPLALLTLAVAVPTMWACVSVAVLAFDAETNPENHSRSSPSWTQLPPEDDGTAAPGAWRLGPDGQAPSRHGERIG